ncbi:MAG: efflux RND transporter periplasmic adaptor subunit, partial [Methylobacter sp.]
MNKQLIVTAVLMLVVGVGAGYLLASKPAKEPAHAVLPADKKPLFYRNPMNPSVTSPVPAKDSMGMDYVPVFAEDNRTEQGEILFYRNPMNPEVTSPVPAKDSMGMDYVPVYAKDNAESDEPKGSVKIDAVTVQNIGVRTAIAKKSILSHVV